MSYFPIKIQLTKTGETMICKTVKELPNGKAFRVIQTNYQGDEK